MLGLSRVCAYQFLLYLGLQIIFWPLILSGQSHEILYLDFKDESLGVTTSITSDQDGFIWLSTGQGLVRFDGTHFVHLEDLMQNVPHMAAPLNNVYIDKQNHLWCFKSDQGMFRINLENYTWDFYPEYNRNDPTYYYFNCIEYGNMIYFPASHGLFAV